MDCGDGKPFPTWKEGLQALGKFVSEMRLPTPLLIHSGNGLHVYWVLTKELEPDDWKPLAEAMKEACVAKGFEVDPAVPADSARVLRPVGTTNTKGGNEVKMLVDADPVNVQTLRDCLSYYFKASPGSAVDHTRDNTLLSNLAVKQEFPPAVGSVVASKCKQIEWAIANQGDVDEPLWLSLIHI